MSLNDYESNDAFLSVDGTVIVEEMFGTERGYAKGPERALISALLFDGVQAYMNYVCFDESDEQSRYGEAFRWVHSQDSDYVFSFENVCEGLGIDPEYLRYGLVNAANSQTFEWKRARRNF